MKVGQTNQMDGFPFFPKRVPEKSHCFWLRFSNEDVQNEDREEGHRHIEQDRLKLVVAGFRWKPRGDQGHERSIERVIKG